MLLSGLVAPHPMQFFHAIALAGRGA